MNVSLLGILRLVCLMRGVCLWNWASRDRLVLWSTDTMIAPSNRTCGQTPVNNSGEGPQKLKYYIHWYLGMITLYLLFPVIRLLSCCEVHWLTILVPTDRSVLCSHHALVRSYSLPPSHHIAIEIYVVVYPGGFSVFFWLVTQYRPTSTTTTSRLEYIETAVVYLHTSQITQ